MKASIHRPPVVSAVSKAADARRCGRRPRRPRHRRPARRLPPAKGKGGGSRPVPADGFRRWSTSSRRAAAVGAEAMASGAGADAATFEVSSPRPASAISTAGGRRKQSRLSIVAVSSSRAGSRGRRRTRRLEDRGPRGAGHDEDQRNGQFRNHYCLPERGLRCAAEEGLITATAVYLDRPAADVDHPATPLHRAKRRLRRVSTISTSRTPSRRIDVIGFLFHAGRHQAGDRICNDPLRAADGPRTAVRPTCLRAPRRREGSGTPAHHLMVEHWRVLQPRLRDEAGRRPARFQPRLSLSGCAGSRDIDFGDVVERVDARHPPASSWPPRRGAPDRCRA